MDVVTITLVPKGYRWIKKGELLRDDDLFDSTYTHKWETMGEKRLEKAMASNVYIRKIS